MTLPSAIAQRALRAQPVTIVMRRVALAAVLVSAASSAASQTAEPTLPSEPLQPYEALAFYEGTWTLLSKGHEGYRETCSWLPEGRRHIVCRARGPTPTGVRESLGVYSYDPARGAYLYHGFGSRGTVSIEVGHRIADGFHFTSERGTGADRVRTRFTIVQGAGGRVNTVSEVSKGEGPWVEEERLEYLRVRP